MALGRRNVVDAMQFDMAKLVSGGFGKGGAGYVRRAWIGISELLQRKLQDD
jgi:hypothetical protein